VHAPGRSLDDLVAEAVEIINPPAKARELCRAKVADRISRVRDREPPIQRWTGPLKKANDYLKKLRKARTAADALHPLFAEFIVADHVSAKGIKTATEVLDLEIARMKRKIAQVSQFPRQHGSQSLDLCACMAVNAAADLLDPSVDRARDLLSLLPGDPQQLQLHETVYGVLDYDCPWRQKLTVYDEGAWHRLSLVIYEAIKGEAVTDLMHYLQKVPGVVRHAP
jgi:hypothetical protein